MWYPLKNSVYALSVASIFLATLLAFAKPAVESHAAVAVPSRIEHPLLVAVDAAAKHLVFEDPSQKAITSMALHVAARALVAELDASAQKASSDHVKRLTRHDRRQAAMPFFSFANLLPSPIEPGA